MGVTGTRLDLWSTQEAYNLLCMISMTNIIHPSESLLISPYHAIPDITVPTETGHKLKTTQGRGFSRVPAGIHARHMRVIIITSESISSSMGINNMHPCI